jgi:hypothetical protein
MVTLPPAQAAPVTGAPTSSKLPFYRELTGHRKYKRGEGWPTIM